MWHGIDIDDTEALRRLDCQIAERLGWRDAGLRFSGPGDVLGDYLGVPPGESVPCRVPHFTTSEASALYLPVRKRDGNRVYLMASPLAVALIFLNQNDEPESGLVSDSAIAN